MLHFNTNLLHLSSRLANMKKGLFIFLTCVLILSCKDDDDNILAVDYNLEVEDFVWKGLNTFYYWQGEVPDLADNRFTTNKGYANFLSEFDGKPDALFDHLMSSKDRFSWVVDDYVDLENQLNRIGKTSGIKVGISEISPGSEEIILYVRYVLPNTDADIKGIKRGDLFWGIDGTALTKSNYRDLLNKNQFTVNFATNVVGTPSGNEVTLLKATVQENPVHKERVIQLQGQKVGYLMYNAFLASRETELENTLRSFQTENIDHLVIDFRYNPGGSVNTAINLASMITGQFDTTEVFARTFHNEKLTHWNDSVSFKSHPESNPIKLRMDKIYAITSGQTASASELLINSLKAHIDVVTIGEASVGKNVGSYTIRDWIDNDGNVNPNHTWAMQPIAFRITDKNGNADFANGLTPDVSQTENVGNLGVLGDINEPLLKRTLQQIGLIPERQPISEAHKVQNSSHGRLINTENSLLYKSLSKEIIKKEFPPLLEGFDPEW